MRAVDRKSFRYFYWIILAFLQKNAQLILISFLAGVIGVITVVSVSPYFVRLLTTQQTIIGIAGSYSVTDAPREITQQISNSLVEVGENGEIIPALAEQCQMNEEATVYRCTLKQDLTWEDGTRFTSADLSYTFQDVTIERPTDREIVFQLTEPLPIFPTLLTEPVVQYPLQGVAGLYNVERVRSEFGNLTEVHLTPNRDNLPIYIYRFYDNETQLINAYKIGEITQFTTTKQSIAELFSAWKNTEIERTVDYTQLLTLFFNMNNPLLQERDVRRAIAMSIDKELIEEQGEEAFGPIPPTSWAYNSEVDDIQYDPDLASSLFENYQSGSESAELKLSTFFDYLSIADSIRTSLNEIGIQTNVNVFTPNELDSYDMLLAFWRVPQDPDQYFFWHSTQTEGNISNYADVRVDKLLEDGRDTLDPTERREIYQTFQRVIVDDLPAFYLYYPYAFTISRK